MEFTEDMIVELLGAWPALVRATSDTNVVHIEGGLAFNASAPDRKAIEDQYQIRIEVPVGKTHRFPQVFELGGCIPRNADYHVNPDHSLCMGTPFAMRRKLDDKPSLLDFVEKCLVPYLFGTSWRLRYGEYPFGEMEHGAQGLMQDYQKIFGVIGVNVVCQVLRILSLPESEANDLECVCGCNQLVGACEYKHRLRSLTRLESSDYYKFLWEDLVCQCAVGSPMKVE